MKRVLALLALSACALGACAPIPRARTHYTQPITPRERDAWTRNAAPACPRGLGYLLPGMTQICQRRAAEGGVILSLAALEAGTAYLVAEREGVEHPGALIPLLGLQDLWLLGIFDGIRDRQLARFEYYVPQDTLAELALAPFNGEVLRHPDVWGGILVCTALGIGVSLLVDESWRADRFGDDANLFGERFDPAVGYPIAAGVSGALFEHVAIAEEMTFRGVLQSTTARSYGPWGGWTIATLLFGLAHAPNALALPEGERRDYLLYGVPFITAIGGYLGVVYLRHGYSLAPPTAIHFWYDFLLTSFFFAMDPEHSPLSARVTIPF